jgi:hypothetical protein
MEILNRKPTSAATIKALALAGVVICLCAAIGLLLAQQQRLERYGREPSAQIKQDAAAVLRDKSGAVVVSHPGALQNKNLQAGDTLFPGDRVQTSSGARATIELTGGMRLTLEQDSLLQLPEPDKDMSRRGAALHLTSGSVHLDSADLGGVVALYTPQAMIELNPPALALVRPPAGQSIELAYLDGLAQFWFPDPETQAAAQAAAILQSARQTCAAPASAGCRKATDASWRSLLALHKSSGGAQRVVLDINISESGAENISVQSGAVDVTTQTRTLRVAQGEKLDLDGAIPTRNSITAESLLAMAPRPPEIQQEPVQEEQEKVFFEIESIQWQ